MFNHSKKTFLITISLAFIVIGFIIYFNIDHVKHIQLLKTNKLDVVNFSESWNSFRESLNISEKHAKIEDFELIINQNNNIHSIRFDIVDRTDDKFLLYRYSNCFLCDTEGENQPKVNRNTSNKWLQYERLINAHTFFSKLDMLNGLKVIDSSKFDFTGIFSTGEYESIGLPGQYYSLNKNTLNKIEKSQENTSFKGYNVRVIRNQSVNNFSTTDKSTTTIFIDSYLKEKRN
jgi:hypothetical protein